MSNKETETSNDLKEHWFFKLLMEFMPDPNTIDISGQTPEEMIKSASWIAFSISTTAGLPPGPIGWATILPEIIALTKLQMNLIAKIAKYYGKEKQLNPTIIAYIFANEAGIAIGRTIAKRAGSRLIIRSVGPKVLRPIAQKISARIAARITQRALGRWIPFVLAPIFGAYSKHMTTRIGKEADKLCKQEIEIEETILCPNGHECGKFDKFCSECGAQLNVA